MEKEHPYEALKDANEETHRILGSLGLVDALIHHHDNPKDADIKWAVNYDTNKNIVLSID